MRELLGIDRTIETYRFGLYGGLEILDDYNEFIQSKRTVYPFAGGRRDQPAWVLKSFKTLDLLSEFFELDKKYGPKALPDKSTENPVDKLFKKKLRRNS